jgi:hypothetical protein
MRLNLLKAPARGNYSHLLYKSRYKRDTNGGNYIGIQARSSEEEVNLMERGWRHQFAGVSGPRRPSRSEKEFTPRHHDLALK